MPEAAYRDGIIAAKCGDPIEVNPHALGTIKHAAWYAGHVIVEGMLGSEQVAESATGEVQHPNEEIA